MAKRSSGGIGKAYRSLRKKAKGLVSLSPKKKFYYAWFYKHCRVNEKRMLFESFHGKNVSDSTLAVLQEMVRRGIADEYEISSIPCVVLFKNGAEADRSVGLVPKEALEALLG